MFRVIDAVITIGRDTERLLLRYRGLTPDKIRFIPNWATLAPAVRPIDPQNPFRRGIAARFVVGLSGNLGFTHDPAIVFEAARSCGEEADIHFLLSGWGLGFETLKAIAGRGEACQCQPGRSRGRCANSRRSWRPPTSGSFPTAGTSQVYRCRAGSIICLRSAAR